MLHIFRAQQELMLKVFRSQQTAYFEAKIVNFAIFPRNN